MLIWGASNPLIDFIVVFQEDEKETHQGAINTDETSIKRDRVEKIFEIAL
ncbi:hypothetical protein C2W64_03458 [Brevibacillus laterosporus]|nr:hypothetical protein [Brevibacillus laterosporus]RAP22807.1 hypothetical protein C2W64_03458 [Brevibacillus laterosporus]